MFKSSISFFHISEQRQLSLCYLKLQICCWTFPRRKQTNNQVLESSELRSNLIKSLLQCAWQLKAWLADSIAMVGSLGPPQCAASFWTPLIPQSPTLGNPIFSIIKRRYLGCRWTDCVNWGFHLLSRSFQQALMSAVSSWLNTSIGKHLGKRQRHNWLLVCIELLLCALACKEHARLMLRALKKEKKIENVPPSTQ